MEKVSKPIGLGLLVAILAIASILRFYGIGAEDLWLDEIYSLNRASVPLNQVSIGLDDYRVITHYAFDHLVLRAWMLGGHSPVYLRTFSALCGILSVLLLYWVARLYFNRETSLVASLFLGLSSYHLYYSQEARAYSLQVLCLLGMVYCLEKALRTDRNRWIAGHIFLAIFAVYLQAFSLFCWMGTILWLGVRKYRMQDSFSPSTFFSSQGMIALAIIPYFIYLLLPGGKTYLDWIPGPQPQVLLSTYHYFLLGKAWMLLSSSLKWGLLLISIYLLYLSLPRVSASSAGENQLINQQKGLWLGWILFLVPIFLFYLASYYKPVFIPDRYVIISLPFFYLLLAAGWDKISRPLIRYGILGLLLIGLTFTLKAHWQGHYKIAWSRVMHHIEHASPPKVPVFISPGYWETAMVHYQSGESIIIPIDSAKEFKEKSREWRKGKKSFVLVTVSDVINQPDNSLVNQMDSSYSLVTLHQETTPSQVCVIQAIPTLKNKAALRK